jgi:ribose transport system ATP-binding protein
MVPDLSVAENLFLGAWPRRSFGQVDRRRLLVEADTALARIHCDVNSRASLRSLSVAHQQMVEIARALLRTPRILVLDEPTSSLADSDVQRLIHLVKDLAVQGVGIIYISHRLAEIEALADMVTVLRDGRSVASRPMAQLDRGQIVELMVGAALAAGPARPPRPMRDGHQEPVLRVRGLTRPGVLHNVSFDLYPGEILGIAGLVGAGRTELARAIFGRDRISAGIIEVSGTPVRHPAPRRMKRHGIGLIPEDRKGQGLVLGLPLTQNASLASLDQLARLGVMRFAEERRVVQNQIADLQVKTASASVPVGTLSGGNQQKVVLAKWIMRKPKVLILDEPTRGVDVQAKAQIFDILRRLAAEGTGIILISSELEEVLDMSHRIITLARGRVVAEVAAESATMRDLLLAAAGG